MSANGSVCKTCNDTHWVDIYAAKCGRDQSAERIAERHGFSKSESEKLLEHPLATWEPSP